MARNEWINLTEQDEDTLKGKHLIFSMENELFGMEIRHITEIVGIQPITEVPEMPGHIRGVTNLRGRIIPVMDARLRFKKPAREYDDRTCIIVFDIKGASVGLIVDSVSEVITIDDGDIAPPPDIGGAGSRYIKGVGTAGGSVKLLLDCQKLLEDDEVESLAAMA